MWNTTEDCCDMEPVETTASIDEAAYSILYGTYNPGSPAYSGNLTDFGISVGMLKFCMEGIGITSLAIFGILGNILSIVVLCSSKMKNSSSCFLLFLAICDMCTLLGAALLVGIPSILSYYPTDNPDDNMFIFNENIVKYVNIVPIGEILMITTVAVMGSTYLIMALTLERYLAVCKPFYARHLCTWERATLVSLLIIVTAFLYNLPRLWDFTYVAETFNNMTMYRALPSEFRTNPVYDVYYIHIVYPVLLFFLPFTFLIILNILIFKEIKKANKRRQSLSGSQKHEISVTRMLFGVVSVFLVCQITPVIHILYRFINGSREHLPEAEMVWCFMLVLNSSVNFLIYCATGAKFREVFCETFCCHRARNKIRRFASSTKTTLRSISSSSNSRNRTYSVNSLNFTSQQMSCAAGVFYPKEESHVACANPDGSAEISTNMV